MKIVLTKEEYIKLNSGAVSMTIDGKNQFVSPIELPIQDMIRFLGCEDIKIEEKKNELK